MKFLIYALFAVLWNASTALLYKLTTLYVRLPDLTFWSKLNVYVDHI